MMGDQVPEKPLSQVPLPISSSQLYDIVDILGENAVKLSEPMRLHTSYKIGGPVSVFLEPDSIDGLIGVVKYLHKSEIPFLIFGNGSNLLVDDEGINGVVIKIEHKISNFEITGTTVICESGILLSKLSNKILEASLTGFEFASGIPGTIGGAIYMNAGAYGGEMKDVVKWVEVMDKAGTIFTLHSHELDFGYRTSRISKDGLIVLRACLELKNGEYDEIKSEISRLTKMRIEKQPLELPSCGSVFKRPTGFYAGALIQEAGMKGEIEGKAQVSPKHCGFIVNLGGATSKDIYTLIERVQKKVFEVSGVMLERELKYFGK